MLANKGGKVGPAYFPGLAERNKFPKEAEWAAKIGIVFDSAKGFTFYFYCTIHTIYQWCTED